MASSALKRRLFKICGFVFAVLWVFFVFFQWLKIPENQYAVSEGLKIFVNIFTKNSLNWAGQFFFYNFLYNCNLIFQAVLFIVSVYGYGRFVLLKFLYFDYTRTEKFIFSNALGFGIAGFAIFAVSALHMLYKSVIFLFIGLGLIFLWLSVKIFGSKSVPGIKNTGDLLLLFIRKIKKLSFFDIFILSAIIFSSLLSFFSVFSPDIREDSLNYHLAVPAWQLINHGIADMPHNIYFNLFSLYGSVYAAAMGMGDVLLPRAVNFYISMLGALVIPAYISIKYFGKNSVLPALAIICSTYQFNELVYIAGSDSFVLFFTLSMISAMLLHTPGNMKTLILSALAAGFAMASKATSLAFSVSALCVLFLIDRQNKRIALKETAVFICAASVPLMPWLVKNYVFRGNPFFPFMTSVFGLNSAYDPVLIEYFKKATNLLSGESFHAFKTFWNLFFAEHTRYNILTSPFILAFAAFLPFVFKKNENDSQKKIMVFAALSFLIMLPISGIARFYFPVFALAAVFCAHYIDGSGRAMYAIRVPFLLIISFFIIPSVFMFNYHAFFEIPLGRMTQKQYLRSRFGYTDAIIWANDNMQPGDKILISDLIGRSFHCRHEYYVTSMFDKYWHEAELSGNENPEEIFAKINEQGFTYILHNSDKLPFSQSLSDYRKKNSNEHLIRNLKSFSEKFLEPVYVSPIDKTAVYKIKKEN